MAIRSILAELVRNFDITFAQAKTEWGTWSGKTPSSATFQADAVALFLSSWGLVESLLAAASKRLFS